VQQFPTPLELQNAGPRKWEKFLHTRKLWRPETRAERLAIFATANALPASAPVVHAKRLLALSLAKLLQTLQHQIDEYRGQITQAFRQHPDHDIFGGLPGAREILGPRLLAELGSVRQEYPDAESLMCQAGVSPVGYQSGQVEKCRLRRACNKALRFTIHLWANASRKTCDWAQTYYEVKRAQGHTHASALRCLGKRWLKILWRMWQQHTAYDETKHCKNLERRGSFVWEKIKSAAQTAGE
jgi:hypothetical protein